MFRMMKNSRGANLLLQTCLLLTLWSGMSRRDSFKGGRKVLGLVHSSTSYDDVLRGLNAPSFVCTIVTEKGDSGHCFGFLVSSRWLVAVSSCAPKDRRLSDNHVQVICRSPKSSKAHTPNEFDVVEVHPLRSATTGERQEPNLALLRLGTDAPGPHVKFDESDGPDFYILEQKEIMDTFLKGPSLRKGQTRNTLQNANIDLIGLPLVKKHSSMRNRDRSDNSLHQITTCCLATPCQLFTDGVKRCIFSRITPLERKSLCLATGTCNEPASASSVTPCFHRSLSASIDKNACLDSPRPIQLSERRLIPPFEPLPFCSNDMKAKLQSMSKERMTSHLKHIVERDDATGVNKTLTCSEFNINAVDNHHETFLHDAAWHNSSRSAKVLCELGIDTEVKNKQGKTALLVAANRASFEALKVILNCSANVNAVDNRGRTALHFAAFHNSSKIAKILCNGQINLEAKDDESRTALIVAAKRGSLDTLKVIANHNASVNAQDSRKRTALHYAVKNCDIETTKFLVNKEADPLIKDDKGKKPHDLIPRVSDTCNTTTIHDLNSILGNAEIKQK